MEKSPHVMFAGAGAEKFASEQGVPFVPKGSLVSKYAKKALEDFKKNGGDKRTEIGHKVNILNIVKLIKAILVLFQSPGEGGTVGAVALDSMGNLAAATSTGGINGKMVGRCSDTSMVGSGTYADNYVGAVSTTGKLLLQEEYYEYCFICDLWFICYNRTAGIPRYFKFSNECIHKKIYLNNFHLRIIGY